MVNYYEMKCELFGGDKLVKRITMDDLSEDDLQVIQSGLSVILPFKDQTCRPLSFVDHTKDDLVFEHVAAKSIFRCNWYLMTKAVMEDEMAQKVGMCNIVHSPKAKFAESPELLQKMLYVVKNTGRFFQALPCRFTSYHILYDGDHRLELLVGTVRAIMTKFMRLRLRTHSGSRVEHDYFLMTIGIPPVGLIQSTTNQQQGNNKNYHQEYIQRRKETDQHQDELKAKQERESNFVEYPNENDVLLARGLPYRSFPGNRRWDELVRANMERYTSCAHKFEKTCVAMEIVSTVKDYKGRFLLRNDNGTPNTSSSSRVGWKILNDEEARLKVASAFRSRSRPSTKATVNDSPTACIDQPTYAAAKRMRIG